MTNAARGGGALIAALVAVVALVGVAAAAFTMSLSQSREVNAVGSQMRAMYLAEGGVGEAVIDLAAALQQEAQIPPGQGSKASPMSKRGGEYWTAIQDNHDTTFTITSTGSASLSERRIEAVVQEVGSSAFDHAIFAGNSSGDPNYVLPLGGTGSSADEITGDIYSGGDIDLSGDAVVNGEMVAAGGISGGSGETGETRPLPDIAGMDYENNNDFDVAKAFSTGAAEWRSNALGGSAWELPESDPEHIFRKNPSDRTTETSTTSKDDYFLEDPYMPVQDFTSAESGEDGHTITLSGTMGNPGQSGTDKVYFIDGNLWVHGPNFMGVRFINTDPEGARVTFVVKGNVYFSDNVEIEDDAKDAVAFIAIKDPNEPDSGNIYLGDPRFGTLVLMESFLYAENDFYDNNLSASGSKTVRLEGNMTAGNHVAIDRDYVDGKGNVVHSKLTVEFDDRISTGAVVLPGIPTPEVGGGTGLDVVFWHEVPVD